jgi:hypothetical protein
MRFVHVLVMSALVLAGCSSGTPKADPSALLTPSITGVEVFKGLSHRHLLKKSEYPHRYPQTPPVGGEHAPRWLKCAVYSAPVPNEFAVHSIEHGGIWITHLPTLDKASVAKLAALAPTNPEYVLVSPYPGVPAPVVVSTWGLQLKLQSVDDPRLQQFIKTYAGGGQGGEPNHPCRTDGLTPEQVPQFLAQLT